MINSLVAGYSSDIWLLVYTSVLPQLESSFTGISMLKLAMVTPLLPGINYPTGVSAHHGQLDHSNQAISEVLTSLPTHVNTSPRVK